MDFGYLVIYSLWPDVSVNKNESELQMFAKYFNIIDKKEVLKQMVSISRDEEAKSKNTANIYRTKGNKYYKDLDYAEALKMYNTSISRAPRDSVEFGLAVANRSAVLFEIEKYKECLQDINTVLKSEYPNDLRYKIFLRQSKCYLKLNMNLEAAKSIRKTEEYVEKLSLGILQISSINEMIKEIKSQLKEQLQKVTSEKESDDDLVLTEPSLKGGENPKFLNAAKVVDFKYTRQLGRHVVANTDIKKGDVLFLEKPYSFTTNMRLINCNICAFCLKSTLNCIPCTVCTLYFYCSDNCRQDAWDLIHRWECLSTRRNIMDNVLYKFYLSVLFKATRDGFKTTVEDESVYGNKLNNHSFVNKLVTHKSETPKDILKIIIQSSVWMVLYLKNFTDYFDWLYVQPNRPEGSLEELYNFVGGQLVKYSLQMNCSAVTIQETTVNIYPIKLVELQEAAIGLGIYISSGLMNHSCIPNTVQSFNGTTTIVKAINDIKKGTEITINYLRHSFLLSKTEERQLQLNRYIFTCSCRACTDPSIKVQHMPFLCLRCNGKAFPFEKKTIFAKCSECHLVFNIIEYYINMKRIAELQIIFRLPGDQNQLDRIYELMKKTCHKHNILYLPYYVSRLQHYEETGQIKKSVAVAKLFAELSKNIYGDITPEYLCSILSYAYLLAKYSIILKKQNSQSYKKLADESKAIIKESVNTLQYLISNKNIKKIVTNITKYLNSDNIDMVTNDCILEELRSDD